MSASKGAMNCMGDGNRQITEDPANFVRFPTPTEQSFYAEETPKCVPAFLVFGH